MVKLTDMAFRKSTGTLNTLQFISCVIGTGVLIYLNESLCGIIILGVTLTCELTSILLGTVVQKVEKLLPAKLDDNDYELYMGMSRMIMIIHIFLMAFNTAFNFIFSVCTSLYFMWVI